MVSQSQKEVAAGGDKRTGIAMLNPGVQNCLKMLPAIARIVITIKIDWKLLRPISISSLENFESTLPNTAHGLGIVGIIPRTQ
jgi:hypothetical protein